MVSGLFVGWPTSIADVRRCGSDGQADFRVASLIRNRYTVTRLIAKIHTSLDGFSSAHLSSEVS